MYHIFKLIKERIRPWRWCNLCWLLSWGWSWRLLWSWGRFLSWLRWWWALINRWYVNICNILFFFNHKSNQSSYFHFRTFRLENFSQVSFILTFKSYCCLISLDFTNNISNINFTSFFDVPLNNFTFFHSWWKSWHFKSFKISAEKHSSVLSHDWSASF